MGDFAQYLAEWGELWGVEDLPGRVSIEFSRRMRSTLGRCNPQKGLIRIHHALSDPSNADLLGIVLCHEAAHMAAYILFGPTIKPHGSEWKSLAEKAGISTRATLTSSISREVLGIRSTPKYIYEHTCTVCRSGFTARRTDRRWRCRHCRQSGLESTFQVIRTQIRQ
ncbi:SprT family zinc-dependent metalloprotease [Candidatus Zixiibacteriota bacterium]